MSPHGMLDRWALARSRLRKLAAARLFESDHLSGAACLHALTDAEARAMRGYGLTNPVAVCPNAVHLPQLGTRRGGARTTRRLLFLGRIDPKKGVHELLRAWAKVRADAERAQWQLLVAGWGEPAFERSVRDLFGELNLAPSVSLLGPRFGEGKAEIFREADAFVLPSRSEGLPIAVLEAWSWGLPVLMTSACNLPEGFSRGAALEIAPDVNGVAEGLRRLFAERPDGLEAMGARGRVLVEERFAWPEIGERMADVYAWLLGGGGPPACVLTD